MVVCASMDSGLEHFDGAFGDGFEEKASVEFLFDTAVKNDNDSLVIAGADQAPEALSEFENRLGQGVFPE